MVWQSIHGLSSSQSMIILAIEEGTKLFEQNMNDVYFRDIPPTGFQSSAIKDHMLVCDHRVNLGGFGILADSGSSFVLELKESLFVLRDNPVLNGAMSSVPLYLFGRDSNCPVLTGTVPIWA